MNGILSVHKKEEETRFLPEKAEVHNFLKECFPLALLAEQTSARGCGVELPASPSPPFDTRQLKSHEFSTREEFSLFSTGRTLRGRVSPAAGSEGILLDFPQHQEVRDSCGALSDGGRGQGLQPDRGAEGCESQVPPSLQEI